MTLFVMAVAVVIIVSAICSVSEAAIYAVRRPYIRTLMDEGSAAGVILDSFKSNMERPISAILIVNTTANTAGASVAGAMAAELFGGSALIWFSVFFTFGVLIFSEIAPKIVGVVYVRPIARAVAIPWHLAIRALFPVIWIVEHFSSLLKPGGEVFSAPEEEVVQLARISADEGSISPEEARLVRNALALNEVTARDVMTPRTVVYRLPETLTLREMIEYVEGWTFSRIPVHAEGDSEEWTGVVRASDVLSNLARDRFDVRLSDLARPLHFVPEGTEGHILLNQFLARRTHLFAVVDEFGGMAGVVTLEDIVEALIGSEIVDEVDQVTNLQAAAREKQISSWLEDGADEAGEGPEPLGGEVEAREENEGDVTGAP